MSYEDALTYLYTSQPAFHQVGAAAYKPGLANTEALMAHLEHPERRFRSVHVAGTNGKGSTSHMLAAVLQTRGMKVGLYTSPHLVDFRERIRINGEMIPEDRVVAFVEEHRAFLDALKPSFFETTMAMAFAYFAEQQVDIAVIEVGLGGRLDSTNIITPELSVITNIGLDHTEFLGTTLPQIAHEKAGIIKPGVPVVIGETHPETAPVFIAQAQACHAPVVFADQQPPHPAVACQLQGAYQERNVQTIWTAVTHLEQPGINPVITQSFLYGCEHVCDLTGLRGRWETLLAKDEHGRIGKTGMPVVLCDTGHNAHGIATYVEQLKLMMAERRDAHLRIVFGMVSDKDVTQVLALLPKEAAYYWTQAQTHRAIPAATMRQLGLAAGLIGDIFGSVEDALRVALHEQRDEPADLVFIGGSNYVVGEALNYMDKQVLL